MKQTRTPSAWYAGVIAKARTQTETLLEAFESMPAPTTPQEVERAAKAILAVVKLADFADRLSADAGEAAPVAVQAAPLPLNRHERRRLDALGKTRPMAQSLPNGVTIPTKASG